MRCPDLSIFVERLSAHGAFLPATGVFVGGSTAVGRGACASYCFADVP
ncbi:hypothetical protein SynSYN20_02721 [Synechococcus sp. SYN20]|nr:hypothetical protein SynSYN20_02721 [Synechococcus sp. SYN20]